MATWIVLLVDAAYAVMLVWALPELFGLAPPRRGKPTTRRSGQHTRRAGRSRLPSTLARHVPYR